MKYRKKAIEIEAEQWFPGIHIDGVKYPIPKNGIHKPEITKYGIIETLEGEHIVSPGDWIITGIKGEKYPCKPDIFEMTYDKI